MHTYIHTYMHACMHTYIHAYIHSLTIKDMFFYNEHSTTNYSFTATLAHIYINYKTNIKYISSYDGILRKAVQRQRDETINNTPALSLSHLVLSRVHIIIITN